MSIDQAMSDAYDDAAIHDRRVAVLGQTRTEARAAFTRLRDQAVAESWDGVSFRSSNGAERIDTRGGGSVIIGTATTLRGASLDRVYLPANADHEVMEQVAPAVCASKDPAIIGYFF